MSKNKRSIFSDHLNVVAENGGSKMRKENVKKNLNIIIELKELIPPLRDEEIVQLEKSIQEEGCKDPLVYWVNEEGKNIIIDGHNRYRICKKFSIDFDIKEHTKSKTLDDVKEWMIDFQLGRRNLSDTQRTYLIGIRYNKEKLKLGNNQHTENAQNSRTSEKLAKAYGVSSKTVLRAGKVSQGIDKLAPEVKQNVLSEKVKISKGALHKIAKEDVEDGSITDTKAYTTTIKEKDIFKSRNIEKDLPSIHRALEKIEEALVEMKVKIEEGDTFDTEFKILQRTVFVLDKLR